MIELLKEVGRKALPRLKCSFNGIDVRTYKISNGRKRPDFEEPMAGAVRENVELGCNVVVVGGGHGVTSTIAAMSGAEVTVFETSPYWADVCSSTHSMNGVKQSVDVVNAIIGHEVEAWGFTKGVDTMHPDNLPKCNWLVLDCEGAEHEILEDMSHRPHRLSVETHEPHSSPESMSDTLCLMGYEIESVKSEGGKSSVVHGVIK